METVDGRTDDLANLPAAQAPVLQELSGHRLDCRPVARQVEQVGGAATNGAQARPSALVPATVNFATANGTALAGQDYQAVAETLTFGLNETTKRIAVPIVADALVEQPESFTVTISNPTGGATLGQSSTVAVTIIDTTQVPQPPAPPGDDDTDEPRKETEDERRQRERTNRGGRDEIATEGQVIETRYEQPWPSVVIAKRDGAVEIKLIKVAQAACASIQVGDYLEVDGEKQHEQLYHADNVEIRRNGERVK